MKIVFEAWTTLYFGGTGPGAGYAQQLWYSELKVDTPLANVIYGFAKTNDDTVASALKVSCPGLEHNFIISQ